MKCLKCGFIDKDSQSFINDYYYDYEEEDEVSIFKCPECNNDNEDEIVDEDEE